MMIESKSNYSFIIMNTDRSDKEGTHWWSFLDLHTKKNFFLIILVLKASKNLSSIMIKIYSTKYSMVLKNLIKR